MSTTTQSWGTASESILIDAPAGEVWDLVADVTRVGEHSPETTGARWIRGADGPEVGAEFVGSVDRNGWGLRYRTLCHVDECVRGEVFAFTVRGAGRDINTWRYDFRTVGGAGEGDGDGDGGATEVTESFRLADTWYLRAYWLIAGVARGRTNRRNMRATLESLKKTAETDD